MGTQRTRVAAEAEEPVRRSGAAAGAVRAAPGHATATAAGDPIGHLQRSAGNRATAALLRAGQAKLEVGAADDAYEQEADRVARQVVANLRAGSTGGGAPDLDAGSAPLRRISRLQRAAVPEVGRAGGGLDAGTESAIASARRSGGAPLPDRSRSRFEAAFGGADLSGVRLHTGPAASELNERVSARAFTIGRDVFFHGSTPDLDSTNGQELLAHELTHTIQQTGAG